MIAQCDLSRVYFTSGGWEGTESALKMARQYFAEKDEPDRGHTITDGRAILAIMLLALN